MNAAETIRAAIDQLELYLDETGWDGWDLHATSAGLRLWRLNSYPDLEEPVPTVVIATVEDRTEAEFIVTLRRTAEAQLAILLEAQEAVNDPSVGHLIHLLGSRLGNPLRLARAILGGDA